MFLVIYSQHHVIINLDLPLAGTCPVQALCDVSFSKKGAHAMVQALKSGLPAKDHNSQIMYSREGCRLVWELMVLNQVHLHHVCVNFLAESVCVCVRMGYRPPRYYLPIIYTPSMRHQQ